MLVWQGVYSSGRARSDAPLTPARRSRFLDIRHSCFPAKVLECNSGGSRPSSPPVWFGAKRSHRRPVALGRGHGLCCEFGHLGLYRRAPSSARSATNMNAPRSTGRGTGLLAVIVLLVIMNWFFSTKFTGAAGIPGRTNRRRKSPALKNARSGRNFRSGISGGGLILLGFTSLYREGFEVVLFSCKATILRLGGRRCAKKARFLGIVLFGHWSRWLTFILQQPVCHIAKCSSPTGILLGMVLLGDGGRTSAGDAISPLDTDDINRFRWRMSSRHGWECGSLCFRLSKTLVAPANLPRC